MNNKYILWMFFVIFTTSNLASQIIYTVGASGDFTSISSAYTNCTTSSPYIIEIASDYSQEALPITLGSLINKSSINSVTIRPESGNSNLNFLNTGTENDIFLLSGANYLTIDGRPAGIGNSEITIENNQTAKGHAIKIEGNCTNIELKYLTIKGSNQSSSIGSDNTDAGVLMIGESSTGALNNIEIDNCEISKSTGGNPSYLLTSYSSSGSVSNCSITNCKLVDAGRQYISLYTNSSDWLISSNNFYQTSSFTPPSSFTFSFIRIVSGADYTISNNYFGGQEILGGGDPFTINSANAKAHLISFHSNITGDCFVENNTFSNISFTTTNASSPSFSIVSMAGGNANYTIGSIGKGNTIGSSAKTSNITLFDNGSTATASTALFYSATSADVTIEYNDIGGIDLSGSNTTGNYMSFYSSNTENVTFSNNTIGNVSNENMNDDVARTGPIYIGGKHGSTGTLNTSSNTVQNFYLSNSSSGSLYFLFTSTASSVNASDNVLSNIESNRDGLTKILSLNSTGDIITNANQVSNITLNGANSQAFLFDITSSSGDITCNENEIGNTTSNNITLNGNTDSYGIIFSIPTGKTASLEDNNIQNIYLSNSGSSNQFYTILSSGTGNFSIVSTEINGISTESTNTSTAIYGIYQYNTGTNNIIRNVGLNNFSILTTGANSTRNMGIYLSTSNTDGLIEKTRIINFSNLATGSPSDYGIYSVGSSSSWTYKNNVIIMDNENNTNSLKLIPFRNSASGTTEFYHNTLKISGSVTSGSDYSVCFLDNASAGSIRTINNNIFYNNRNGGTGSHYGVWNVNASGMDIDNNFYEATKNKWDNSTYSVFTDYTTNNGSSNEITGTITLNALGGVTSGSSGTIEDSGIDLFTSGDVTDDLDGNSRDALPWIGAFETVSPLPIQLIYFKGSKELNQNNLKWSIIVTKSDHIIELERSTDGESFITLNKLEIEFESAFPYYFNFIDITYQPKINYYRLKYINKDKETSYSKWVSINNQVNEKNTRKIRYITNLLGQIVEESYTGIKVYYFEDGTIEKMKNPVIF